MGSNWINADSLQVAFFEEILAVAQKLTKAKQFGFQRKTIPFENGLEFNDFHHPYI
jgi:hypothetical protein